MRKIKELPSPIKSTPSTLADCPDPKNFPNRLQFCTHGKFPLSLPRAQQQKEWHHGLDAPAGELLVLNFKVTGPV